MAAKQQDPTQAEKYITKNMPRLQSELERALSHLETIKPYLFEDYVPFPRFYLAFHAVGEEPSLNELTRCQREELEANHRKILTVINKTGRNFGVSIRYGHVIVPNCGKGMDFIKEGLEYYTFIPKRRTYWRSLTKK